MDEKLEMIARIQNLIATDSKNKSQILRELHLSTSTLSDWAKGKGNPSASAIMKLASYFNVTSDYILFGTQKTENPGLTPPENQWLQLYYSFSESERQELLKLTQSTADRKAFSVLLDCLNQLSGPEREVCGAFIRGVLAEKNLKEILKED